MKEKVMRTQAERVLSIGMYNMDRKGRESWANFSVHILRYTSGEHKGHLVHHHDRSYDGTWCLFSHCECGKNVDHSTGNLHLTKDDEELIYLSISGKAKVIKRHIANDDADCEVWEQFSKNTTQSDLKIARMFVSPPYSKYELIKKVHNFEWTKELVGASRHFIEWEGARPNNVELWKKRWGSTGKVDLVLTRTDKPFGTRVVCHHGYYLPRWYGLLEK